MQLTCFWYALYTHCSGTMCAVCIRAKERKLSVGASVLVMEIPSDEFAVVRTRVPYTGISQLQGCQSQQNNFIRDYKKV